MPAPSFVLFHGKRNYFFWNSLKNIMSDGEQPPFTQFSQNSDRKYDWIFLFNYDPNNEFPFTCIETDFFKGTDFPFFLINGHLCLQDRLKPRNLPKLSGSKFCVFAKVEAGNIYLNFLFFHYARYRYFHYITISFMLDVIMFMTVKSLFSLYY